MRSRWGWALLLGAMLAGCGGGGDAEGDVSADDTSVNGSFAVCAANADGITSAQTVVTFSETSASLSLRQYFGKRCGGSPFVSIRFPLILIAGAGTQPVAAPSSGSVTAVRFTASSDGGALTVDTGSDYVRVTNGRLEVVEPNTRLVIYADDLVQASYTNEKDLRVRVGGQLFLGKSDGTLNADGYPTGVDYTHPWTRLE